MQGVTSLTQVERAAAFGASQPPSWRGNGGKGEGAIRMSLLRLRQVLRTCVKNRLREAAG